MTETSKKQNKTKEWPRFFLASERISFQMVCAGDRISYLIKKFFPIWGAGGSLIILALLQSLKHCMYIGKRRCCPHPLLLNQILIFAGSASRVVIGRRWAEGCTSSLRQGWPFSMLTMEREGISSRMIGCNRNTDSNCLNLQGSVFSSIT